MPEENKRYRWCTAGEVDTFYDAGNHVCATARRGGDGTTVLRTDDDLIRLTVHHRQGGLSVSGTNPTEGSRYDARQGGLSVRRFDAHCGAEQYHLVRVHPLSRRRRISCNGTIILHSWPGVGTTRLTCEINKGGRIPLCDLAFLTWVCAVVDSPARIIRANR